jgi:hypothetical protein
MSGSLANLLPPLTFQWYNVQPYIVVIIDNINVVLLSFLPCSQQSITKLLTSFFKRIF